MAAVDLAYYFDFTEKIERSSLLLVLGTSLVLFVQTIRVMNHPTLSTKERMLFVIQNVVLMIMLIVMSQYEGPSVTTLFGLSMFILVHVIGNIRGADDVGEGLNKGLFVSGILVTSVIILSWITRFILSLLY